jgi:trans-aconitate 2-methyltransferase
VEPLAVEFGFQAAVARERRNLQTIGTAFRHSRYEVARSVRRASAFEHDFTSGRRPAHTIYFDHLSEGIRPLIFRKRGQFRRGTGGRGRENSRDPTRKFHNMNITGVAQQPLIWYGIGMSANTWNPDLYQSSHSFVWKFGRDLLALLAPQAGERILDVGCGTGQLTAEIAQSGAEVLGIDSAGTMVDQAHENFPNLRFEQVSATALPYREEFDAVFSNAVLHWVRDAETAAAAISRALRRGGRFVAEFGGHGNVQTVVDAAYSELQAFGVAGPEKLNPWYYPSVGEYASLLERHQLEVTFAALFDRPTPLDGGDSGFRTWIAMFGKPFTEAVPPEQRGALVNRLEERVAPRLRRNGEWSMDYRRLRIQAVKTVKP